MRAAGPCGAEEGIWGVSLSTDPPHGPPPPSPHLTILFVPVASQSCGSWAPCGHNGLPLSQNLLRRLWGSRFPPLIFLLRLLSVS